MRGRFQIGDLDIVRVDGDAIDAKHALEQINFTNAENKLNSRSEVLAFFFRTS